MTSIAPHWADVLKLRSEIITNKGLIADLQMSLYSAVYSDRDVPYRDPGYYSEITEPTPGLISFLGAVARRLGLAYNTGKALFHLDQGMGGGKSHALVGLYHLGHAPERFFATELGIKVRAEADQSGELIDLTNSRVVVLSADNMTPGATSPEFGPAKTLYERFLWSLLGGDHVRYERHLAEGPNKASLTRALASVTGPILILLDELMDYAMQLSDQQHVAGMPGEKAFLSNLMDAVDEIPRVVLIVVMIRSDFDDRGYTVEAEDFRGYLASRLDRNGTTIAVTEAQDFAAIIRRRLFERIEEPPIAAMAERWRSGADAAWTGAVFDRLGASRGTAGFGERLRSAYPFHPDLMALVRDDWSRHAGFQRVRSTVEVFSRAAHHWMMEHQRAAWAPPLIGVGDLPLTSVLDQVLSSGLLHGNERAVQGFRQVAAADIVSRDGTRGRARELDAGLVTRGIDAGQPAPVTRMATALYCYSLVPRAQARRGATKAELLAAVFLPGVPFHPAEEIFNLVTSDEEGLGALEVTGEGSGPGSTRYQLAITQTLTMFFKQAKAMIAAEDRDAFLWERTRLIARDNPGPFDEVMTVVRPERDNEPLTRVFADVDQNGKTRLVVLDPRRWTLLNGSDAPTRADIEAVFGLGSKALPVDNGASIVVACVNTQRRNALRTRAADALAWKAVLEQLDPDDEKRDEAREKHRQASQRVDTDLQKAFQHYAYLMRGSERIEVEWRRFDDDTKTALKGTHVWNALADAGRATRPHQLAGTYLATLLDRLSRDLTLKEIVQQFYKNPLFPLVVSTDDIRHAIFDLLRQNYEVIGSDGEILRVTSADDLSIGAVGHTLRKAHTEHGSGRQSGMGRAPDPFGAWGGHTRQGTASPREATTPASSTYGRFLLEVANRSLVSVEARRDLANLLQTLLDTVDPDEGAGDLQLADIRVELTASPSAVAALGAKALSVGAKWSEGELDF